MEGEVFLEVGVRDLDKARANSHSWLTKNRKLDVRVQGSDM